MKKDEMMLFDNLKKTEDQIIEILRSADVSFDENTSEKETKKILRLYIEKVKKAERLFEKYESIAEQIKQISGNEVEQKIEREIKKELNAKFAKNDALEQESLKNAEKDEIEIIDHVDPKTHVMLKRKTKNKVRDL